jgi:hypothetical protein
MSLELILKSDDGKKEGSLFQDKFSNLDLANCTQYLPNDIACGYHNEKRNKPF